MTPRTPAARLVSSLPAPVRWRARNAIALARWLRRRAFEGTPPDSYDAAFWDFHAGGDWQGFADVLLRFCSPRSIVDVGCGDGKLLAAVRALMPDLPVLGIDSSAAALARAKAAGVAVERHDLDAAAGAGRAALRARIGEFDVSVSLETAEHLPPWLATPFVDALTAARLVVFSAAQPGQGGTLHMNERPLEYWYARFAARGFRPASTDAAFRGAVADLDLPWWYAANVHLFARAA